MAFEELKQRQSAMWSAGEFQKVAEMISDVHDTVVERLAPEAGERWLDIACGTGGIAERAASAGADVTGIDFAPALIETAKRRAEQLDLDIDYRVGDAENLQVDDGSFDIASSSFGLMFAPDQQAAARELTRVTRSGGRIGLANWEPEGAIRDMFAMMSEFVPPPPPDAGNPFDWGREEYVRELLGEAFDLSFEHAVSTMEFESAEGLWQLFLESFGPTKTAYERLDEAGREKLHRTWIDFHETRYGSNGKIVQPREYLLVLGTKR